MSLHWLWCSVGLIFLPLDSESEFLRFHLHCVPCFFCQYPPALLTATPASLPCRLSRTVSTPTCPETTCCGIPSRVVFMHFHSTRLTLLSFLFTTLCWVSVKHCFHRVRRMTLDNTMNSCKIGVSIICIILKWKKRDMHECWMRHCVKFDHPAT